MDDDPSTRIERLKAFRASISSDRESAWESARYDREQRDQITSRIRFGSVVFNGASLLTVLNAPTLVADVPAASTLISAGFFLAGVISAGYSLITHQTALITVAGQSSARAIALDRAVSLVNRPVDEEDYQRLGEAMDEAHELQRQTVKLSLTSIVLQNVSTGAWLGGALTIALSKIGEVVPSFF